MTLIDEVRDLVSGYTEVPGDEAPLALDSLTLVTLLEALEERFAIRVAPREATPEHFGSVARMARYVEGKRGPA